MFVAVATLTLSASTVSAHRRDEYLQAARIDIQPQRVDVEVELTPGIALADRLVREIDRDGNGTVSGEEARRYAAIVARDMRLEIDSTVLTMVLVESRPAPVQAMAEGTGATTFRWTASLPRLEPGGHRVRFSNAHHRDISVYMANVLVPASSRVTVTGQDRDVDQREFAVDYTLKDRAAASMAGVLWPALALGAAASALVRFGRGRMLTAVFLRPLARRART